MSFNDRARRDDGEQWDEPKPGSYSVEVTAADVFVSKSGNEIGKATLLITEGEHAGKQFDHIMNFGNDVGFSRSKTALLMYGLKWESIHDAPDPWEALKTSIDKIVGTKAEVTVAINNGFTNIDVVRAVFAATDVPADGKSFQHVPADDDDDVPY
jgi:hypothetical protein